MCGGILYDEVMVRIIFARFDFHISHSLFIFFEPLLIVNIIGVTITACYIKSC